jgi:hypothetical protein
MILNSKIIICAGGNGGAKWNMHLGVPKHMILVHGEPLIRRTQRQLLERGFTNVYLACSSENKEKYLLEGVRYIPSPPLTGHIGENSCVWHYRKHIDYSGTTAIMYGDVYYTDEFIDALAKDSGDRFRIYGRRDRSHLTGNWRQGEPFAIILTKDSIADYFRSLKRTMIALPDIVERSVACYEDLSKYTYRKFVGIPYEAPGNVTESEHWYEWDDLTDDFDGPDDWDIKSKLFPHIFYRN